MKLLSGGIIYQIWSLEYLSLLSSHWLEESFFSSTYKMKTVPSFILCLNMLFFMDREVAYFIRLKKDFCTLTASCHAPVSVFPFLSVSCFCLCDFFLFPSFYLTPSLKLCLNLVLTPFITLPLYCSPVSLSSVLSLFVFTLCVCLLLRVFFACP